MYIVNCFNFKDFKSMVFNQWCFNLLVKDVVLYIIFNYLEPFEIKKKIRGNNSLNTALLL